MADKELTPMKRPRGANRPVAMESGDSDDYGYGLCLRLENFELDALKLAMPQPGKEFKIEAVGKVTCVHESKTEDGKSDRSVMIQITALSLR